ncbi:uncharacterized protein Triagg1_6383 [Trichoderma aggressivum f. europaeum]|uniref:Uncharacterized protein n=1 Tax=Trichoderma aggressivum f. europaeum TaxID=173218 RepID=A0AAE1J7K7_9HYPO|nr:hypothetical protein Triagg1_6383 [Trichoderma aggressivum f. europaeum]
MGVASVNPTVSAALGSMDLSPEIEKLTITVGSAGKNFYARGWRVGTVLMPTVLMNISGACAVDFEKAEAEGFWDDAIRDMKEADKFGSIEIDFSKQYNTTSQLRPATNMTPRLGTEATFIGRRRREQCLCAFGKVVVSVGRVEALGQDHELGTRLGGLGDLSGGVLEFDILVGAGGNLGG